MKERIFTEMDIVEIAEVHGPGSLVVADSPPNVSYTDISDVAASLPVWWRALPTDEVAEASLALRAMAGTQSLGIIDERPSSKMDGLALSFADHLLTHRQRTHDHVLPSLISITPPQPPNGCVRLPHLT